MSALAPAPLTPKSGYMTPAIARESSRGTSLCTSSDESTKNGKSDGSTVCRHSVTPSRAAAALTSGKKSSAAPKNTGKNSAAAPRSLAIASPPFGRAYERRVKIIRAAKKREPAKRSALLYQIS